MPLDRPRPRVRVIQALELPPLFRLVTLREVGDSFAHAKDIAATDGAGTLVYVGRFDVVEFAVVLEPDEPLATARRALYAGCAALGDALAAHAPPEKAIEFDWPDAIRVDGGLVGGVRLGWPPEASENEPADWLVLGAMVRTAAMSHDEPGLWPASTALDDEGFGETGSGRLVESFARHFLVAIDAWQEEGFGAVARSYLPRLAPEKGVRRDIAENGDLLVRRMGGGTAERRALVPRLATPSWFDPHTRGPRL
jgi:hypothetical protein